MTEQMGVQATVCAKFGLPCIIYMGSKDMERQALNVFRMRLLGAEVRHLILAWWFTRQYLLSTGGLV